MCHLPDVDPSTYRSLLRCHTRSALRHAVRCGVLDTPFHGAYVGCNRVDRPAALPRAAQLSIGRDLPAGFHTAARLGGFGVLDDGRTHLLGPEEHDHSPRDRLIVHGTARVPDPVVVDGVEITGAARTAIDLARTTHPADGLAVLDAALRCGAVGRDLLDAELLEHRWLRGIVSARRLVAWADPRAESPQESRMRWIALAAGLPAPEPQVELRTASGKYRLDLGYREKRVGMEYDGDGHADRSLLRYDRNRVNEIGDLDWRLIYCTDHDIFRTPARTAWRLARALGCVPAPLPLARDGSLPGGENRRGGRAA